MSSWQFLKIEDPLAVGSARLRWVRAGARGEEQVAEREQKLRAARERRATMRRTASAKHLTGREAEWQTTFGRRNREAM